MIDFIEFLQMMNKVWSGVDETIRAAFELFDNDGSGEKSSILITSADVTSVGLYSNF